MSRFHLVAWALLPVGAGAAIALYVRYSLPTFVEIYEGFGADLPAVTRLVLDWPGALWLVPALAIAALLVMLPRPLTRARYRRAMLTLVMITVVSVLAGLGVVAALYAPIVLLGRVV